MDFVFVGPQRTGTTWIYEYLLAHPQTNVSRRVKESFFFDENYDRGFQWYENLFDNDESSTRCSGEVAPTYFISPDARERIYAHNPDVKVLITLREPLSRFSSLLQHFRNQGLLDPDVALADAIRLEPTLLDSSLYFRHTNAWISRFGRNNVEILLYENLVSAESEFAARLCNTLGLDDFAPQTLRGAPNPGVTPRSPLLHRNVGRLVQFLRSHDLHAAVNLGKKAGAKRLLLSGRSSYPALSAEEASLIWGMLREDLGLLETRLGVSLQSWRDARVDAGIKD